MTRRSHYEQRIAVFQSYLPLNGGVVFAGDSLVERGPWAALFPTVDVRNYGIDGDRTGRLTRRLDQIAAARPAKIFLMIGANDISTGSTVKQVLARYADLLDRLAAVAPNARLFVDSVLPREAAYSQEIRALNSRLMQLSAAHHATYVDLYSAFATQEGALDPAMTEDGLHLNPVGYERWRALIDSLVKS